jgi:FkbM family methyltransferase
MTFFLEDVEARGFRPQVVFDVGAHVGHWSEKLLQVFPDATCYLFEPNADVANQLDRFCRHHPKCEWFQCGLGSTVGELTLTLWPNAGEGTSFLPAKNERLSNAGIQRSVPVKTLDSMMKTKQIPAPDLIKVDTEGYELEVLKGGQLALCSAELVVLEVSLYERLPKMPIFHEVVAFMTGLGFVLYDIPGFHRRHDTAGVLVACDLCFIRETSKLRPIIRGLYA